MSLTPVLDTDVVAPAVAELQGETSVVAAGAAAATKMDVPALRAEDTLLSVIAHPTAGGAPVDDTANSSIADIRAFGTVTITGDPLDGETVTVNDAVYTFKDTPTDVRHVKIVTGDQAETVLNLIAAINAWENRRLDGNFNTPAVVASETANSEVARITAVVEGTGNGPTVAKNGAPITLDATDPGAVTATFVSAVAGNDITVNGVTFTIVDPPVNLDLDMALKGSDAEQAEEASRIINAYQNKYGNINAAASFAGNVTTISAAEPRSGNSVTLTEAATNTAVSGSGFLAGGTDTGGIVSTTNNSANTMVVTFYNKRP